MDEYLLQLDIILRQTVSHHNANDIFQTENSVETIKEISKSLKVKFYFFFS